MNRTSIIFIYLCLLMCSHSFGQFETNDYRHGMLVRGKIYAGPTSTENKYGFMYTYGSELRFFNRHSIGVDWVYFRNAYEQESLSAAGYYENNGTFEYKERSYFLFDYRYYFLNYDPLAMPYINILTKVGHQHQWFYDGTGSKFDVPYDFGAEFNEYGIAVGTHIGGRFGVDMSAGIMRQFQKVKYGKPNIYEPKWKIHMRINLYLNVFKIRNKKDA
ncbi:MAG: hypothetical protein IT222_09925 [Crocinitomix sp.]|nr:hypothetical protein [Crocinitomix sp.]